MSDWESLGGTATIKNTLAAKKALKSLKKAMQEICDEAGAESRVDFTEKDSKTLEAYIYYGADLGDSEVFNIDNTIKKLIEPFLLKGACLDGESDGSPCKLYLGTPKQVDDYKSNEALDDFRASLMQMNKEDLSRAKAALNEFIISKNFLAEFASI